MPQWVMIVVGVVKAIAPRFRNKMIKTRKVLAAIIEVEETHGDQGLWKGVHEARLRGVGYTLTPEQNAQLDDFKIKVFDQEAVDARLEVLERRGNRGDPRRRAR
jgi:hypothetical protein